MVSNAVITMDSHIEVLKRSILCYFSNMATCSAKWFIVDLMEEHQFGLSTLMEITSNNLFGLFLKAGFAFEFDDQNKTHSFLSKKFEEFICQHGKQDIIGISKAQIKGVSLVTKYFIWIGKLDPKVPIGTSARKQFKGYSLQNISNHWGSDDKQLAQSVLQSFKTNIKIAHYHLVQKIISQ